MKTSFIKRAEDKKKQILSPPPLSFQSAFRLKMAENWLALGLAEEALHELSMIPHAARCHPDVLRVQKQIASLSPLLIDMWLSPRRYKRNRIRPLSPPNNPPDYSFPQY